MHPDADAQRGVDPLDAEPAILVGGEDLAIGPDAEVAGERLAPVILRREPDRSTGEGFTVPIEQPPDSRAARLEPDLDRALRPAR